MGHESLLNVASRFSDFGGWFKYTYLLQLSKYLHRMTYLIAYVTCLKKNNLSLIDLESE